MEAQTFVAATSGNERSVDRVDNEESILDWFLYEPAWDKALIGWLGDVKSNKGGIDRRTIIRRIHRDIVEIDALLSECVDQILHHPRFQQLESSWRGLEYLVDQAQGTENVKIRVLDVSWAEVARDLKLAIEFDQSQLFQKIYSEEFGHPGGEPFGVLIGDYQIRHRISQQHPIDDIDALRGMAQIAAASFSPFIAAVHPSLLGLDRFDELNTTMNLNSVFQNNEYLHWNSLRQSDDARFVGLTIPHMLMRLPYAYDGKRVDGFCYRELTEGADASNLLWGNAAYAIAAVLIRTFSEQAWLANIRGLDVGGVGAGKVEGLPTAYFETDCAGLIPKYTTDVLITEKLDKILSDQGLIPLCQSKGSHLSGFFNTPSIQEPKKYDEPVATLNAQLSSSLQYMFCVSRFGQYLKVMGRDKIGGMSGAYDLQNYLQRWVLSYTLGDENASTEQKAKYPLQEASVEVKDQPGKPGSYFCVFHLRPHYQLEGIVSNIRLVTELAEIEE